MERAGGSAVAPGPSATSGSSPPGLDPAASPPRSPSTSVLYGGPAGERSTYISALWFVVNVQSDVSSQNKEFNGGSAAHLSARKTRNDLTPHPDLPLLGVCSIGVVKNILAIWPDPASDSACMRTM